MPRQPKNIIQYKQGATCTQGSRRHALCVARNATGSQFQWCPALLPVGCSTMLGDYYVEALKHHGFILAPPPASDPADCAGCFWHEETAVNRLGSWCGGARL